MQNRTYTVADAILDTLKAHKVTHLFGYPGGAILPFYDALPYHKDIKHILVRNEQGAAFMAQGFARSTKQIGVCVSTSGPGATNLVTGIADAMLDSIPILCITGQVPLNMIGKDMFQEVDMTGITLNITKHNYLLEKPEDAVFTVCEAIKIAMSGRPGPVHIDVPKDIMASPHPRNFKIPKIKLTGNPFLKAYQELDKNVLNKIVKILETARKPVLLLGHGIKHSHAEIEIEKLVNQLGIPVITTIFGKGTIKHDNPYYLGALGMHGFYHANMALHEADLIINIGSRFDDRIVGRYDAFGKKAVIVHVDIDKSELNKVVDSEFPIHSDAKNFINHLLNFNLKKLKIDSWLKQIKKWEKDKPYLKNNKKFTVQSCLSLIDCEISKNPEKYIIVTDVGQHQMWAMLSLHPHSSAQWLSSGGAGTMGFALPAAIGASFANPNKTIVVICGDGGIQMNIQELGVLAEHKRNIKIFIMNNSCLGMPRQWQELFYKKNYSHVEITSPNYEKIADAYGINGKIVNNKKDFPDLKKLFSDKKPWIFDCHILKEDNVFPMVPGGKTLGETITNVSDQI